MRVVPLENDGGQRVLALRQGPVFRTRGSAREDRLTAPMIRRDGAAGCEVDWQTALEFVARELARVARQARRQRASARSCRRMRRSRRWRCARSSFAALGSDNVDFRLRQSDFRGDGQGAGVPWLGDVDRRARHARPRAGRSAASCARTIRLPRSGCATRRGRAPTSRCCTRVARRSRRSGVAHSFVARRRRCRSRCAEIVVAAARGGRQAGPSARRHRAGRRRAGDRRRASLGERKGNPARQLRASSIRRRRSCFALAQALAGIVGATIGLPDRSRESASAAMCADALPHTGGGMNARTMLAAIRARRICRSASEPEFDCASPVVARAARSRRPEFVVVMSPFQLRRDRTPMRCCRSARSRETAGTFVNCEGRAADSSTASCQPLGETRPAWKVLRVLGSLLGGAGFDFETIDDVRDVTAGAAPTSRRVLVAMRLDVAIAKPGARASGLERVADMPIHFADPLVRRAPSLQQDRATRKPPRARMNALTLARDRRRRRCAGEGARRRAARRC